MATATTGSNPSALAFSRCAGVTQGNSSCPAADDNNLFVANSGSDTVSSFAACIQVSATCASNGGTPDGSMVEVAGSPVAAGISPTAIVVDPAFTFVYVVNSKGNSVSQYRYSSVTGALTPLTPAVVSAGTNPAGGGITGGGAYFFTANNNSSSMSAFTIGVAGRLSPGGTPSVALAGQPSAILVR
jgi:DNA-binding beta-propeller fold protein YncE